MLTCINDYGWCRCSVTNCTERKWERDSGHFVELGVYSTCGAVDTHAANRLEKLCQLYFSDVLLEGSWLHLAIVFSQ